MRNSARVALVAAAVLGPGIGAASASAYTVSGGSYTGTGSNQYLGSEGSIVGCTDVEYEGTASGAASTSFTPTFTGCTAYTDQGYPATISSPNAWTLTITGGSGSSFTGSLGIPIGSAALISIPALNCNLTLEGNQAFVDGVPFTQPFAETNSIKADNVAGGSAGLTVRFGGATLTPSIGCPASIGTHGYYDTNTGVTLPGVTVGT